MPNGRRTNRSRGERPPRPEQAAQNELLELFGFEIDREPQVFYPRTNEGLITSRRIIDPELRESFGMVAETVEIHPDKVLVEIPKAGEPVKYDREIRANLETKDDLKEQPAVYEEEGNIRRARGRFVVEVVPVLVIGGVAYGFRRTGGREREGMGSSWPLQSLPGNELAKDIMKEFLIIGRHKKTGKQVIIASELAEENESEWVRAAKRRVLEGWKTELQQLIVRQTKGAALDELNKKIKELSKVHTIETVKFDSLGEEFEQLAQTIETIINGREEKIKGLFRFDDTTNTVTVTKPARLELEEYDIELYDATGRDRQIVAVESPKSSQSFELNQILTSLEKQKLAQTKKGGPVALPQNTIETLQLRKPYAVIPQFTN